MDHAAFLRLLSRLVAGDTAPAEAMAPLLDEALRLRPGLDRSVLEALPWGHDAAGIARWLARVFDEEPPPGSVTGLWFGLYTRSFETGECGIALSVAGCGRAPGPSWWEGEMSWDPASGEAPSTVLRSLCFDPGDEDAIVEQVVVQGYAALAVCAALRALPSEARRPLAVAFGFNAGDPLELGRLDADGWHGGVRAG